MTDYEKEFQRNSSACGEPLHEFSEFFATAGHQLTVLDLGCGQGRDVLAAARCGHDVVGVDRAPTGVEQMLATAAREGLAVTGIVADIEEYELDEMYDVVVLNRVVHILGSNARRRLLLRRACACVKPGGFMLVADTRSNRALIANHFSDAGWRPRLHRGDTFIVERPSPASA